MNTTEFDVIVAGAGPSGCAAAIALRLAGLTVCLVDRPYNGRRKIGESIPGASVRLLNRLGINGIESLLDSKDYKRCLANISSWGTDTWEFQSGLKNPEGGGYHINRVAFDNALRDKAISVGVVIYEDMISSVGSLSNTGLTIGLNVEFKRTDNAPLKTKWIVDATGRKAAISRMFGVKRTRLDSQMAAIKWIKASSFTNDDHATRIKSVAYGWWYTSLLPDNSRVIGFQGLPKDVSRMHKDASLFFNRFNDSGILSHLVTQESILEESAYEAGVAKPDSIIADRLLCVGDAALSFDPLSSQGILFALYSGIKGAEAIGKNLTEMNTANQSLNDYEAIVDKVFSENQKHLRYFYMNEFRYKSEPYWKSRQQ